MALRQLCKPHCSCCGACLSHQGSQVLFSAWHQQSSEPFPEKVSVIVRVELTAYRGQQLAQHGRGKLGAQVFRVHSCALSTRPCLNIPLSPRYSAAAKKHPGKSLDTYLSPITDWRFCKVDFPWEGVGKGQPTTASEQCWPQMCTYLSSMFCCKLC